MDGGIDDPSPGLNLTLGPGSRTLRFVPSHITATACDHSTNPRSCRKFWLIVLDLVSLPHLSSQITQLQNCERNSLTLLRTSTTQRRIIEKVRRLHCARAWKAPDLSLPDQTRPVITTRPSNPHRYSAGDLCLGDLTFLPHYHPLLLLTADRNHTARMSPI